VAQCGERLKEMAEDGSRWKSILFNLLIEDNSKSFQPVRTRNLAQCEKLKIMRRERSR